MATMNVKAIKIFYSKVLFLTVPGSCLHEPKPGVRKSMTVVNKQKECFYFIQIVGN